MQKSVLATQLGRTIRRLRLESGFSQEGFADHCGVHRTYMGAIERGEKSVSIDAVAKLAAGLGIPISSLFEEVEADYSA